MSELKEQKGADGRMLRSRFLTLKVEADENGRPRLVMQGEPMENSGFAPGDSVEAIIQPGLVSILNGD